LNFRIDGDAQPFKRAMIDAQTAHQQAAEQMSGAFERATSRARNTVNTFMAGLASVTSRFSVWGAAAGSLLTTLQGLQERGGEIAPRLGGDASDKWTEFTNATAALAANLEAVKNELQFPIAGTALETILNSIAEKAIEATRAISNFVASGRSVERRNPDELAAEAEALEARLERLRERFARAQQPRGALAPPDWFRGMFGSTPEQLRAAIATAEAEMRRIEELQEHWRTINAGWTATIKVDAAEDAIEGVNRQIRALELNIDTFGMAAGEAARYRAEITAMINLGPLWAVASDEERLQLLARIELLGRLTEEYAAMNRERRAGEAEERAIRGGDAEIARLQAQARTLTMSPGDAARENFTVREMARYRAAGVEMTDEARTVIGAQAEAAARAAQNLADLRRKLQEVEAYGRIFSQSMERAFSSWLDGAQVKWTQLVHNMARDIAVLALRTAILQPLFGGGGVQGGGLFGQFLGSLIPGRAEGGDVAAGRPYVVGERGAELFVPRQAGTIVPNGATGGGGGAVINMRIDLAGANGEDTIARISTQAARAAAMEAVRASNEGLPARQHRLRMLGT
jgi:hypothetical protein